MKFKSYKLPEDLSAASVKERSEIGMSFMSLLYKITPFLTYPVIGKDVQ